MRQAGASGTTDRRVHRITLPGGPGLLHYSDMMIRTDMLKRALQVAALNTVIALGITVFGQHDLASNLVYSQCIGMSIWACIDIGQMWLVPDRSRHWRRLFWIVPTSAVLGYFLGTALASGLLPGHSFGYLAAHPGQVAGFLIISLMAGGVSTYFFMSREQLAAAREEMAQTRANAEAAQRLAAESQLKLLQTQLEPHMLFNTLANLRALITLDPAQAQDMLDRLVAYLRTTLSASRATSHPLQAEFDRLRDYLELMRVRMGERLHYTLNLPPALAGLPVPPLLLQPLVENAIKHGLEPQVQGGSITVQASQRDGQLTLQVQDTGVGWPTEPGASGFGLTQIRERLHAAYGAQATITLIAISPSGTCATVQFPLK